LIRSVVGSVLLLPLLVVSGSAQAPPSCVGQPATIVGTEGDDTITLPPSGGGHDRIAALGGNDTITVTADSVLICADAGNDRIRVTDLSRFGLIIVNAGSGNDVVETRGAGFFMITPGPGEDVLRGGPGNELALYERAPRGIVVDLRTGNATGEGRDRLLYYDAVFGSRFNDRLVLGGRGGLHGGMGRDVLIGGRGRDLLTGDEGADRVEGRSGADDIEGNEGNDVLLGGAGADRIKGGSGRDRIDGGPGQDWCVQGEPRARRCP
jgi:Ca2+-binding RTX toxin-like protein